MGSAFIGTLQRAIHGPNIQIKEAGITTLMLDSSKQDLIHFFHSASSRLSSLVKKTKGKTRTVQTLFSTPQKEDHYKDILFADHIVVFSEQEKTAAAKYTKGARVDCILPCIDLPSVAQRKPSTLLRTEYSAAESLLIVGFAQLSSQQDFMSLLYIVREYQRRAGFRFLLFLIQETKETGKWKERLQTSILQEKLTATTIVESSSDYFSFLDGSDLVLWLSRHTDPQFSFPEQELQALSLGKPLLCYNVPPANDAVRGFQSAWVCQNTEDVVRVSMDIAKEAVHLEQISTEVARYMQSRLLPENVASRYQEIYDRLLKS